MARILVIDDEEPIRYLLRVALENNGHEVIEAAGGQDALKLQAASPAELVITDINMPDKDGLEVMLALRRETPRPRMIVMTGGGGALSDRSLHMARLMGACALLQKPFSLGDMVAAVESALRGEAAA